MGFFDWLTGLFGGGVDPLKEYEFEDVITLTTKSGKETEYLYMEGVKYNGKYYAVLELRYPGPNDEYKFSTWEVVHASDGNYFQPINDNNLERKVTQMIIDKMGE